MSLHLNDHSLTRLLYVVMAMFIVSCGSTSKMVYQMQGTENNVRFYVTDNPKYSKGKSPFYARVDSSNVQIFYSFQPSNIYKTYRKVDNNVYTMVTDKQPMLQLTLMDSIVLSKADNLMDSLGYKDLKRTKGATGFVVEIAGH